MSGLVKEDFASMYPNAQIELDSSIENTYFYDILPLNEENMIRYNCGKYNKSLIGFDYYIGKEWHEETKTYIFSIADYISGRVLRIACRQDKLYEMPRILVNLYNDRVSIKKKMKLLDKDTDKKTLKMLDSLQNAKKVLMNSSIGYCGFDYSRYSDLSLFCLIVGFCRELTGYLLYLYPDYSVEVDTDGIIFEKFISEEELTDKVNADIRDYINKEYFNLYWVRSGSECRMTLEAEPIYQAYFRHTKGKNYMIREYKDSPIIYHGVSFKGSRKAPLFNEWRNVFGEILFNKNISIKTMKKKLYDKFKEFKQNIYEVDDLMKLTKSVSVKHPNFYKDKSGNSLSMQLIRQAEETFGKEPSEGDKYYYIKTISECEYPKYLIIDEVHDKMKDYHGVIDWDYYITDLYKCLELFLGEWVDPNLINYDKKSKPITYGKYVYPRNEMVMEANIEKLLELKTKQKSLFDF